MSTCIKTYIYSGQTYLVVLNPQPTDITTCTMVLQSGAEIRNNPFLMTQTEATELGAAIALIWVTVGVLKMVARRS